MSTPAWPGLRSQSRRGWPPGFVIVQLPNAPLLVALGAWLAGKFVHGLSHAYASSVFYVALGIWAYEEAARGVNWFRQLLGFAVLIYVAMNLARALHA